MDAKSKHEVHSELQTGEATLSSRLYEHRDSWRILAVFCVQSPKKGCDGRVSVECGKAPGSQLSSKSYRRRRVSDSRVPQEIPRTALLEKTRCWYVLSEKRSLIAQRRPTRLLLRGWRQPFRAPAQSPRALRAQTTAVDATRRAPDSTNKNARRTAISTYRVAQRAGLGRRAPMPLTRAAGPVNLVPLPTFCVAKKS